MKTNKLLTAIVCFTIPVIVTAQTTVNQSIKNYEAFFVANTQKLNLPEDERIALINMNDPIEIMKQAEELEAKAQALRNQAKLILQEATNLDKKSEINKIVASEVSGKLCNEKFFLNKQNADSIINSNKTSEATASQIKNLLNAASREIKLAQEMREEAYSWSNNGAKLGSLGNAEEKEFLALDKLDEVMALLTKINRTAEPIKSDRNIRVDIGGAMAQQNHIRLKP